MTQITEGIPGLEAKHVFNSFTLNDWAAAYPRVVLDGIPGLHSLPPADDNRDPNVGRIGESIYPGFPRGKTVVYEGRFQASTLAAIREMSLDLRTACADRSNEGTMVVTPHSGYGSTVWQYRARVFELEITEDMDGPNSPRGPWQRTFALGLTMSDPRFYLNTAVSVSSVADGVEHTVENTGTAPTDPVIVVTPTQQVTPTTIVLTNTDVNNSAGADGILTFDMPALTTLLTVDFAARSAVATVGGISTTDALPYLDMPPTWWDENVPGLAPGDNDITVDGGAWTASFRPAAW